MVNTAIVATGFYVPEQVIDNGFFAETNPEALALGKGFDSAGHPGLKYRICDGHDGKFNSTFSENNTVLSYEKILTNTGGIKERRRVAKGETLIDMIEKAFHSSGFPVEELDGGIVIATISDDIHYPSVANRFQERLGICKDNFFTADIHAACAGFTHGLHSVDKMIKVDKKHYLIVGAETLTRQTDYSEVNCDLFGDGCGLVIAGPANDSDRGILATFAGSIVSKAKGSDISAMSYIFRDNEGYLRMPEGPKVFNVGTPAMIRTSRELMRNAGLKISDLKMIFPQQANGRMLDHMDRKLETKCYRTLERYGNMSAANVPVALVEAIEKGVVEKGDFVIGVAVGSGLVYSGALIRL